MIRYKDYSATVEFDDEAGVLHGEVVNTRDVISFEATSAEGLAQAFHDSVDDYLAFCRERGEPPEKPFSGNLMVRLGPQLHGRAYLSAKRAGISHNAWISRLIDREMTDTSQAR